MIPKVGDVVHYRAVWVPACGVVSGTVVAVETEPLAYVVLRVRTPGGGITCLHGGDDDD